MDEVTYDRMIYLDKYVSNTTHKHIISGPNVFIHPNPSKHFKTTIVRLNTHNL